MWPFGKSTEARLQEALAENQVLSRYPLSAKVVRKTAVFSGELPHERLKNLLVAVAEGINGVENADTSAVVITGGEEAVAGSDPLALAREALARIKADPDLAGNPIDVIQRGERIILRGAVDSEAEAARARELAEAVAGAGRVDAGGLQVIAGAAKLNVTDDDGDVVYTVQPGDTLSGIALRYYGSASRGAYMKIANANGLADPNKIYVGQKLKIPGTVAGPDGELA
ncbi:LysM peptidoglycan-binding domain-containing protein [Oceanithermus sp.]